MAAALLALLALAAMAPAADDAALLPGDGVPAGYRRDGAPRLFEGADLYGHIDGGAELFFEFGFDRLTIQRYARGADEITLELYRMRDGLAALGVYLAKCGRETPAAGLPARHTAGRHQLLLVRGPFFLAASNDTGRTEVAPLLVDAARTFIAGVPEEALPDPFAALPAAGRVAGSERLIRGPLALASIITLGDGDPLELGGRLTAAAAEYDGPAGRHYRIVASYADERVATAALAALRAHLDSTITVLRDSPRGFVFRDYAGKFGAVSQERERIELRVGLAAEP